MVKSSLKLSRGHHFRQSPSKSNSYYTHNRPYLETCQTDYDRVEKLLEDHVGNHMKNGIDWLIEWCFTPLSTVSQWQLTLFMSSWVSPVLGWGSEVSCPRTLPWKMESCIEWAISKWCYMTFTNDKFKTFLNWKSLHRTILSLIKMADRSPKRVVNTVGKREIAHNEQFLLFPQCF